VFLGRQVLCRQVLCRKATGSEEPGPGGDDQRALRAGERRAERLDGVPVDLAVRLELREIVDEGGVDDPVRERSAAAQAFEILEIAAMGLRSRRGKGRRSRIRAGEADYLVSRGDQFADDGRANEAGRAGDEDTHEKFSRFRCAPLLALELSW
jgi:hypothetical protein